MMTINRVLLQKSNETKRSVAAERRGKNSANSIFWHAARPADNSFLYFQMYVADCNAETRPDFEPRNLILTKLSCSEAVLNNPSPFRNVVTDVGLSIPQCRVFRRCKPATLFRILLRTPTKKVFGVGLGVTSQLKLHLDIGAARASPTWMHPFLTQKRRNIWRVFL